MHTLVGPMTEVVFNVIKANGGSINYQEIFMLKVYKYREQNLNPVPYYASASLFGHKVHMDQNEKLIIFGVTHVVAIDGRTSKIVGYHTMPLKSNYLIYENVFRFLTVRFTLLDAAFNIHCIKCNSS